MQPTNSTVNRSDGPISTGGSPPAASPVGINAVMNRPFLRRVQAAPTGAECISTDTCDTTQVIKANGRMTIVARPAASTVAEYG